MPDSAICILYEEIKECKEGCIVLCRSTRAANLVKLQLMELSKGRGLLGVEVLGLSSYVAKMAKTIGLEGQIIGSLGREMILSEILSERRAPGFGALPKDVRLTDYVSGFNQAISDMKKSGISAERFKSKAGQDKIKQLLAEVYTRYDERLEKAKAIDNSDLMKKVSIAVGMSNTMTADGARIIAFIPGAEQEMLEELSLFGAAPFTGYCDVAPLYPISGGVIRLSARQGERLSREVARLIKRRHVDTGIGYERMCICIPSSGKYSKMLADALDWAGIPTGEPIWSGLSDHPVGSSIIAFMELVSISGMKLDVFKYCASHYWGMDLETVSSLKGFQKIKGTLMELSKWAKHSSIVSGFSIPDEDILRIHLNELCEWADRISSWVHMNKKSNTWEAHCSNLRKFIDDNYVKLISGELDPASMAIERKAIDDLREIIDKIEEANLLMEDQKSKVDWDTFAYSVSEAIRKTRIMKKAASKLGVAIAEPKDINGLAFDTLVIYEVTESNFPTVRKPKWLLSDEDLIRISKPGGEFCENTRITLERTAFDAAIASCKGQLVLAIPSIGDDERKLNPSVWVADVEDSQRKAGGDYRLVDCPRKIPAALRYADCVTETEQRLYKDDRAYYGENKPFGFEALKTRNVDEGGARLKSATGKVIDESYVWTPSKINGFLKCSLSAVTGILLKMREDEEYEEMVSGKARGNMVHNALKVAIDVLTTMRKERKATKEQAKKAAIEAIERTLSYSESYKYSDASEEIWKLVIAGTKPALVAFIAEEADYIFDESIGFLPRHTEITLPFDGAESTISIDGMEICCKARIDRIDTAEGDVCAIYDYKTGNPLQAKEDIQVEFYAILCKKLLGYKPVVSMYLKIEKGDGKVLTRVAAKRGFIVEEYKDRLVYARKFQPKSMDVSTTSFLPLKEEKYDYWISQYEGKIGNAIRNIRAGKFLEGINPEEHNCGYCQRKNFCWGKRVFSQVDNVESAGE
ncbi:MAG: ATP-dependent helicase/deoxyribonuclease subunit B [Firmicutes bacterium ADurb.Bin153]|nr:MAG: ATP-dependent helicase/deoxyribonuclease subunit B [Firmicutes bacterium ADurb.Bin153]